MDGELGETGVERNRNLIGVGISSGWAISGLKSLGFSCLCCFLIILGIILGFSKTAGFGSGLDLVCLVSFLGASF